MTASQTANGALPGHGGLTAQRSEAVALIVGKPPDRNGVGVSVVATPAGSWATFLDFLTQRFPAVGCDQWRARMGAGQVVDERGAAIDAGTAFRPNRKLFYYRSIANEPSIPFHETVLFQDELIVAADKPHFLPVTPAGRYVQQTLLVRLKQKLGIESLAPMHRIDRETAGVVLFSVRPETRDAYQKLFREGRIEKTYHAIAPWRAEVSMPTVYRSRLVESAAFMQMQAVVGEANAITAISVDAVHSGMARYVLRPSTGQKHQLRAHMSALGLPIVNDRIYPVLQPEVNPADVWPQPLQLLAKAISFTDPVTGNALHFESQRVLDF
jgi:tRNA pseudouridine32 synthase / 23S rRNA pseudouridine746 synthase